MLALWIAASLAAPPETPEGKFPLRVMTYNVHSCKGRDGEVRPDRIAEIVKRHDPDVVALQEVRVGRVEPEAVDRPAKSPAGVSPPAVGEPPLPPPSVIPPRRPSSVSAAAAPFADQPAVIAEAVGMHVLFYPLVRLAKDDYGLAVLSRHPMRLVRAANLPTLPGRAGLERRGAIWVELDVGGRKVQLINTHLGLTIEERAVQIDALLGPEWLGAARARPPLIVCGDLNSPGGGGPYQRLSQVAVDAAKAADRKPSKTFPTFWPLLRLDYVFVSRDIGVQAYETPRTPLTRRASDHLPVIADLLLDLRR